MSNAIHVETVNVFDADSDSLPRDFFKIFNQLKADIETQNDQLLKVDEKVTVLEDQVCLEQDFAVCEMLDRLSRKHNVILFNVPEHLDADSPNDVYRVRFILNFMGLKTILPRFISRIGALGPSTRPRPIKITFHSSYDASMMLKLQPILKSYRPFNALAITADRSKAERVQMTALRAELRRRRQRGDGTSVIRFVDGIPRIIRPPGAGQISTVRRSTIPPFGPTINVNYS